MKHTLQMNMPFHKRGLHLPSPAGEGKTVPAFVRIADRDLLHVYTHNGSSYPCSSSPRPQGAPRARSDAGYYAQGVSRGAGYGHAASGTSTGEERRLTPVLISSGRGIEKRQGSNSSIFQETLKEAELKPGQAAYKGTSVAQRPASPPLAKPGQFVIPVNNPDPEASGRSYNQSKISPEAALQA